MIMYVVWCDAVALGYTVERIFKSFDVQIIIRVVFAGCEMLCNRSSYLNDFIVENLEPKYKASNFLAEHSTILEIQKSGEGLTLCTSENDCGALKRFGLAVQTGLSYEN